MGISAEVAGEPELARRVGRARTSSAYLRVPGYVSETQTARETF